MCMMVAEELGIPYDSVRAIIADTSSLGHNDVTDGSRVTFSAGIGVINSARNAIKVLCARAAAIWGIPTDAVVWENGAAKPAGPNAGKFEPLSLKEIAAQFSSTGGPIAGHFEYNADGAGVSFGTHICDVEVDPETGAVKIVRYTVVQDAGKAVHPSYVEGQMQGGAVQGIGWALNEEYVYGADGRLQNPGFLDYRIPVASDVPMIDAVIVETPEPRPSVWCARRRRDADRAAARGCRQRHCCGDWDTAEPRADVAAARASSHPRADEAEKAGLVGKSAKAKTM